MKRSYDLTPLAEMFREDIAPEELAGELYETLWDYVCWKLSGDSGECGSNEVSSAVYSLRRLWEVLGKVKAV